MATLLPYRYPLDLTGTSPDNLVVDEPHQMVRRKVRCIAPMHAPFFKDSLKVYDGNSPTPLNASQYKLLNLIPLPTAMAGPPKEVYAIIAIVDESVGDNVRTSYQTVGAEFVQSFEAALTLLEALTLDNRPTSWPNVVDRPLEFPATMHLHQIGDTIGWEYASVAIQQLRQAILNGDARDHQAFLQYVDATTAALTSIINQQNTPGNPLGDHIAATNNPHNVTKAQIGLSLVQNYPVATDAEARAGTALNRYMTPAGVAAAIENVGSVSIGNHPNNMNNPHQTNKAQVGLGSVDNFATATSAQGIAGTANNLFMTPAATKAAIQNAVTTLGTVGSEHIARTDNPHGTTKGQVGLGNVPNYGAATVAEAKTGTATDKLVTPAGVKGALDDVKTAQTTALNNHINNTSNPHGVTKAQVGLGSLMNYPPATDSEGAAGTAADRYLTPKSAKAGLVAYGLVLTDKVDAALVAAPNGLTPLDGNGVVPESYLVNTPGSNVRDVHYFGAGRPTINSVLTRRVVTRAMAWSDLWAGSRAFVATAPDVAVTLTLRRNTDTIGTISFAVGQKTGTFTGAAGNAAVGDVIEVYYNGAGETLLKDLVLSLAARAYVA